MGVFDWKHWVVILIVVVLVFGTKKLKGLGADVGESIKGFRNAMSNEENSAAQEPKPLDNARRDQKEQTARERQQ